MTRRMTRGFTLLELLVAMFRTHMLFEVEGIMTEPLLPAGQDPYDIERPPKTKPYRPLRMLV